MADFHPDKRMLMVARYYRRDLTAMQVNVFFPSLLLSINNAISHFRLLADIKLQPGFANYCEYCRTRGPNERRIPRAQL